MRGRISIVAVVVLVASVGRAPCVQEAEASAGERSGLSFDVALDARYDDNILQLSDRDIERLQQGGSTGRFRITSSDDWVSVLRLDGRYARELFRRRETLVHVGADAYRYATNGIKNWSEYRFDVTQELTASRRHLLRVRAGVAHVADFYLRELTDDDASFEAQTRIRESARFDDTTYFASLDQEILPSRIGLVLRWEHGDRDYVSAFDERDGRRNVGELMGRIRPVGASRASLALGWMRGTYAARGDLASTPIPDDDISYDFHGPTARITVPWGTERRGRVQIGYGLVHRHYSTANAFDLSHFGRDDRRSDYRIRVSQRLPRGLELTAEWRRRSNDARFPTGLESEDDVTDFVENRISLGIQRSFGYRASHKAASRAHDALDGDKP